MSAVVIAGDTSGSVTLNAPAVAGTTTLTLPTTSGTIVTTNTMPTGSVLQVVNATYSTSVEIKSTSFVDTGLTATITPKFSTSKILVLVSQPISIFQNTNLDRSFFTQILRGATAVSNKDFLGYAGVSSNGYVGMTLDGSFVFLDSPATTSATTYKAQGKLSSTANDTGMSINRNSTQSSIVLLEIAA
jgi:hypothetical protein